MKIKNETWLIVDTDLFFGSGATSDNIDWPVIVGKG